MQEIKFIYVIWASYVFTSHITVFNYLVEKHTENT